MLSTRKDLLSRQWCAALGQSHNRVTPMPRAHASRGAKCLRFTRPLACAHIDWTVRTSGSIACLYRARLCEGQDVAAKIRSPRVRERMLTDFALLSIGTGAAQRVSLLVLESMIKEFDTDVDFQAESIPTLLAALNS